VKVIAQGRVVGFPKQQPARVQPRRPNASPSTIPIDDASATGRNGIRFLRRKTTQAAVAAMNPP
jgi:hypothetical protein